MSSNDDNQKRFQGKLDKSFTNYMLYGNVREKEVLPEYATIFRAVAVVYRTDHPPQCIYLDVECNNPIDEKTMALSKTVKKLEADLQDAQADLERASAEKKSRMERKQEAKLVETRPVNFMPEVIELPVVSDSGKPVARSFIKPIFNELQPSILEFCHLSIEDFKHAITFEEAFLELARHKCSEVSFDMTCLVTEGDFDVLALMVELLRNDRASAIVKQLQKEFPHHPQLQNTQNLPEKQFVWQTVSRMLRYINFKEEFTRVFEANKDRTVNDFDYALEKLGLSFEPGMHPHVGLDDAIMLQRAHKHFLKTHQLPDMWIKQIEIKF